MSADSVMLRVDSLIKDFGALRATNDVSFSLNALFSRPKVACLNASKKALASGDKLSRLRRSETEAWSSRSFL